jgi:DNA modification methylase
MPARRAKTVAQQRRYGVLTTRDAKRIATTQLKQWSVDRFVVFGLPEIDDRYHVWRVPLLNHTTKARVGELVINAKTEAVNHSKSTTLRVLCRALGVPEPGRAHNGALHNGVSHNGKTHNGHGAKVANVATITDLDARNAIIFGDSADVLQALPDESVHLVFTSPPYFNARPDYTDYAAYEEYLEHIRKVIRQCHRLLAEGRFFVINIAPVLLRREDRSKASRRIAVPFDVHRLFIEEGFDFIDDIIWQKPEGAGWATNRGRRFAADRNPLQYKAVPVTEYVLVYRKRTHKLIDVHIRQLAGTKRLKDSKILGDYDRTNVWSISPVSSSKHPAIFPVELAKRVIRYYSFVGDNVLDPFGGIGTVGEAAVALKRHFALVDNNPDYIDEMKRMAQAMLGRRASEVICIGCEPIDTSHLLL